jgi:hypothetical protein
MKIVPIFAEKLYAFQYDGEAEDEYTRLRRLWIDIDYLRQFAKQNNIADISEFRDEIRSEADYLADLVDKINKNKKRFEEFFMSLDDLVTRVKVLALQKGKRKGSKYKLRLYAIKIDENLFVITGGAIKLVHKMEQHEDTRREKNKLEAAKAFFERNDIADADSFYEFINEDYED